MNDIDSNLLLPSPLEHIVHWSRGQMMTKMKWFNNIGLFIYYFATFFMATGMCHTK